MEDQHLSFEGLDGTECERFIQQIRKQARAASRSRDNDWITELVSTCMTGPALRWYIQLDPEIAEDWAKLQRAMIDRWPEKDPAREIESNRSSVPTPAAAPEPSAAPSSDIISSMQSLDLDGTKTGFIRINSPGSGVLYISATMSNTSGRLAFGTCSDRSQALIVQFTQGCVHRPHPITMLNPTDGFRYLAVAQDGHGALGPLSTEWALLVSSDGIWSSYPTAAVVGVAVWSVCPVDNSMRVVWSAAGSEYLLTTLLSLSTRRPIVVSNAAAFRAKYTMAAYADADLVFEAM